VADVYKKIVGFIYGLFHKPLNVFFLFFNFFLDSKPTTIGAIFFLVPIEGAYYNDFLSGIYRNTFFFSHYLGHNQYIPK